MKKKDKMIKRAFEESKKWAESKGLHTLWHDLDIAFEKAKKTKNYEGAKNRILKAYDDKGYYGFLLIFNRHLFEGSDIEYLVSD